MPGDSSNTRGGRPGATPSEEWITKIADEEDLTRNEVVERLVSSYWTVKEMHGMLEQTEEGIESDGEVDPLDIEALQSNTVTNDLENIRERLDRLESGDFGEHDGESISELRAEQKVLARRVSAIEESVDQRLTALESRFDDEFENLETILDYLIDSTDTLEAEVGSVTDDHEVIRRRQREQERLVDLKRLASRLGVRTGACEYCNTSVEIALLPTPECPTCDRSFTDIEPSTGWFGFGSNTLTVSGEPYIERPENDDRSPDTSDEVTTDEPETEQVEEFSWGKD